MTSTNDNTSAALDYYRPCLNGAEAATHGDTPAELSLAPEIKLIRTHIVKELKGGDAAAPPPDHIALVRLLTALCRVINQQSKGSSKPASDDAWLTAAETILQENGTNVS